MSPRLKTAILLWFSLVALASALSRERDISRLEQEVWILRDRLIATQASLDYCRDGLEFRDTIHVREGSRGASVMAKARLVRGLLPADAEL